MKDTKSKGRNKVKAASTSTENFALTGTGGTTSCKEEDVSTMNQASLPMKDSSTKISFMVMEFSTMSTLKHCQLPSATSTLNILKSTGQSTRVAVL